MKPRFNLQLLHDEKSGAWGVIIESLEERKHNTFVKPSLRMALAELSQRLRKRETFNRRFPLSPILSANGKPQRVTETANGR